MYSVHWEFLKSGLSFKTTSETWKFSASISSVQDVDSVSNYCCYHKSFVYKSDTFFVQWYFLWEKKFVFMIAAASQ